MHRLEFNFYSNVPLPGLMGCNRLYYCDPFYFKIIVVKKAKKIMQIVME